MEKVILRILFHRRMECIGIFFANKPGLNSLIHKAGATWSRTYKCWYLPCSDTNYQMIWKVLKGKAILEVSELKSYLEEKNNKTDSSSKQSAVSMPVDKGSRFRGQDAPVSKEPPIPVPQSKAIRQFAKQILSQPKKPYYICEGNRAALRQFKQELILKSYSGSTIRTYMNELTQFLLVLKNQPVEEFTVQRIRDYLEYCFTTLKLSEATLHSRINALKFYYEQVLKKDKFFWEIPRPKKHFQLPKVLSEVELGRLFNAISNLKHKAILFTAYSAGLRVSEVVNLKITDIDSDRMQILIEKAKGKKDRYVGLGILLLDVLRAYLTSCRPMPKKYVFENSATPGQPYSIRSAQQIFQTARDRAMINKDVGIHSLRHSFATHLLEKGIDIRYIKDLLGHFSIKTTERYLHVKREALINIPNLLDELDKSFNLEW